MRGRAIGGALALGAALTLPAAAQQTTDIAPGTRAESVAPAVDGEIARAGGAMLRGLDKVTGQATDLNLAVGEAVTFGRLEVRLGECRYPAADRDSDAFAEMTVTDTSSRQTLFSGWMIASSPAISALDDARYDVWVVSCSDGAAGSGRADVTYEPDTAIPEGGEGVGPDGTGGTPPDPGEGGMTEPDPDAPLPEGGDEDAGDVEDAGEGVDQGQG